MGAYFPNSIQIVIAPCTALHALDLASIPGTRCAAAELANGFHLGVTDDVSPVYV
jgi:hypothetical protein